MKLIKIFQTFWEAFLITAILQNSSYVLCDIDFRGFFNVAFDPHISSIVRSVVDRERNY